jgi:uracil-DNA glycosylase
MNFKTMIDMYSPVLMKKFFKDNKHIIRSLSNFIESEEEKDVVLCPDMSLIFSCLYLVSMDRGLLLPNSLKVVFLLQDPYKYRTQAHGVAMSTLNGEVPVSLRNVNKVLKNYKEDFPKFKNGDIRGWCTQGVLLWNAALTTREGESRCHNEEWALFTSQFIKWLSSEFKGLVFVLFGRTAKATSISPGTSLSVHLIL